MKKFSSILVTCMMLSGCAGAQPTLNMPVGPQPQNAQAQARTFALTLVRPTLKDPSSARVEGTSTAQIGTCKNIFGPSWHGWYVALGINAKNSFGGYSGAETYYVWFEHGKPVKLTSPENPCAMFTPD
jgi:hypothetical protein